MPERLGSNAQETEHVTLCKSLSSLRMTTAQTAKKFPKTFFDCLNSWINREFDHRRSPGKKKKKFIISSTATFPTIIIGNTKHLRFTANSLYLAEISA